jgi:hypothetical protein
MDDDARNDSGASAGIAAAAGGLVATIVTGLACVGPLVAILLGVSGMGWLAQYAYLRVPATIVTAVLLIGGFVFVYGGDRTCADTTKGKMARVILWIATALAIAVNVFEYFIFPNLA